MNPVSNRHHGVPHRDANPRKVGCGQRSKQQFSTVLWFIRQFNWLMPTLCIKSEKENQHGKRSDFSYSNVCVCIKQSIWLLRIKWTWSWLLRAMFYLTAAQRRQMLFTSGSRFIGFESCKSSSLTAVRGEREWGLVAPTTHIQVCSQLHVHRNIAQFCFVLGLIQIFITLRKCWTGSLKFFTRPPGVTANLIG